MARPCSICQHEQRAAIDQALVAGEPVSRVAAQYRVSSDALARHKASHLPALLARGQQVAEADTARGVALARQQRDQAEAEARQGIRLWQQLRAVNGTALSILKEARDASDHDTALKAIARVEKQLELVARLSGDLSDGATINLWLAPEWLTLRTALLEALAPYPEARAAVAGRLMALEASNGHR